MMVHDKADKKNKNCAECGKIFQCYPENCWCEKLPVLRMLKECTDCFCPRCLAKKIAEEAELGLSLRR